VWNIVFGDRMVSALENIIMTVGWLWGFMAIADCINLLERLKRSEVLAAFYKLAGYI
jgi:hypothetical protein